MDFGIIKKAAAEKAAKLTDKVKSSINIDDVMSDWDKFVKSFKGGDIIEVIRKEAKDAGVEVTYLALLLNEAGKLPELSAIQKSLIYGALGYYQNPYDIVQDSIKGIGYLDDLKVLEKSCKGVADIISADIRESAVNELKSVLLDFDNEAVVRIDKSIDAAAESIIKMRGKINDVKDTAVKTAQSVAETAVATGQAIGETIDDIKQTEGYQKIAATGEKVGEATVTGAKYVTGVQAYQDRQEVQSLNEKAEAIKASVEGHTEELRQTLNAGLEELGKLRLEALHNTVGNFIKCLKAIGQGAKTKEYQFLKDLSIDPGHIQEMEELDMKASDALKVLAVGGSFAAVGVAATPAIVTSVVTSLCAASTGTAISSLSGAAASNAVLAWLGGGSIAAGGGGMAAGSVVLASLTGGVAIGAAVLSIGSLASAFYSRKLTEATKYLAAVQEWEAEIKKSWVALEAMQKRIEEIKTVTTELEKRAIGQIKKLEDIVPVFDNKNIEHVAIFQQAAILVKSMSELAQVSLLDEEGNLTEESNIVAVKTQKLLNTDL